MQITYNTFNLFNLENIMSLKLHLRDIKSKENVQEDGTKN